MVTTRQPLVLVVDGDATRAAGIAQALAAAGYRVTVRTESLEGLIAVEKERPDLIVLEWGMPFIGGDIFLYALRAGLTQPPPVVAIGDAEVSREGVLDAGASAYLPGTPLPGELIEVVSALLAEQ